jgi:hypothetical protein
MLAAKCEDVIIDPEKIQFANIERESRNIDRDLIHVLLICVWSNFSELLS